LLLVQPATPTRITASTANVRCGDLIDAASYAKAPSRPRPTGAPVRTLELRRHAIRDPGADRLSEEGRAQAEDIGRLGGHAFAAVFVSPAGRAAETAAWILRGAGGQLPEHSIIGGLAGRDASGGSPEGMAEGVRALLSQIPDGGRALAVSHTPFVERAAYGLTGIEVAAFSPGDGIAVTLGDDGTLTVEELRQAGAPEP
jgi:phosphohistidine phosphatase SixA